MTNNGQSDTGVHSGAPLFTFDESQRVHSWNAAAERLTGVSAGEVVGRYCWEVLCSQDEGGGIVCHAGCSFHRLLVEHWPVVPPTLLVRTSTGRRRMRVPMIRMENSLFAALLLDLGEEPAAPAPDPGRPAPSLTRRQRLVLSMLAEGKQARRIAAELQLSEMTIRNHIRAVLRELGCNSQLGAVAEARRLGLV